MHPPSAFLEDSLEEEEARQEAAKLEEQRKAEEAERERKKQKVWSLARKRWNQLGSRVSFWFQRCFASGQWRCGPASRHETAQLNIKIWKLWSGWKLSMCMSFEAWYSCLFALRKYSMYDEKFPIKDPEVCIVQLWLAWSPAKAQIFCFKVYIILFSFHWNRSSKTWEQGVPIRWVSVLNFFTRPCIAMRNTWMQDGKITAKEIDESDA